ncbi:hypothetical protein FRC07_006971 [Ceratobasidium sp. 392]|nr:hypothetical protein FRC07_006971 [Ceratobasidium sp. 392]
MADSLHAPDQHLANAGYLSPRTLAGTLDSYNDAVPATRRSPSLLAPSPMGSFVSKAKTILRGKRNSLQTTSPDFSSELPKTRRVASHYQTLSASRPAPQRQATAPLPSRRLTKSKSPRPPLSKSGSSYVISSPIMSNAEANYKYCELIDTADMAARASQYLSPRQDLVRSPTPSRHSDSEPRESVSTRRFPSSQSINRTTAVEHIDSPTENVRATVSKGSRPKSDVFPLSATASSTRSRLDTDPSDGAFDGHQSSRESLSDSHAPFEYDDPIPAESVTIHGLGFGVSETMLAISHAGMLHDSSSSGLDDTSVGSDHGLGDMFSDAIGEEDCESNAGCSCTLAWLGVGTEGRDEGVKPRNDYSSDVLDQYLAFGEDTLTFSMRARGGESPTVTGGSRAAEIPPNTFRRVATSSNRPMRMAQCLEVMAVGGPGALLTPWRAQLDPTCNFTMQSVNAQRRVQIIPNNTQVTEQSAIIDMSLCPISPNPIAPLRIAKPTMTRSRSKTMLATPVSIPPPTPVRRPNTSHAAHDSIASSLWEPVSTPPTPSSDTHAIASSSRTPSAETSTKTRRNTRDMYLESQVAYLVRAARAGSNARGRGYRVPKPYKSLEPVRSLGRAEDEENSTEWIVVSPTQAGPSHTIPRSPAQRVLVKGNRPFSKQERPGSGMTKSPSVGNGMVKSPSTRSGMVKSPSVRSGLAKSGQRRGLSASQSRTTLHASPSQSRLGMRTSPSYGARLPTSSSTRSLPGSPKVVVPTKTSRHPSRPQRSGVRATKAERRRPGFWDTAEKENLPAEVPNENQKDETYAPVESSLQNRTVNALCLDLSPGSDSYQTACSHTPNVSAPVSPRRRKQSECDSSKVMGGSPMALRVPGAPIVPPRSPARPRTYNRI